MWKLPENYVIYGTSTDGRQLTAQKTTSSAAKPRLIIIDRREPEWNPKTGSYSVGELRVRVLIGTVDILGNPRPERLLSDVTFRTPVGSEADQEDWFADLQSIINDEDFLVSGIQQHLLPSCCDSVPEA